MVAAELMKPVVAVLVDIEQLFPKDLVVEEAQKDHIQFQQVIIQLLLVVAVLVERHRMGP